LKFIWGNLYWENLSWEILTRKKLVAPTMWVKYFKTCSKNFWWVLVKYLWPGVRSGQFSLLGLGQVCHLWFGFGFANFSFKIPNFKVFSFQGKKYLRVVPKSTRVKDGFASYSLRVKSMLGSGPISTAKNWQNIKPGLPDIGMRHHPQAIPDWCPVCSHLKPNNKAN